MGGGAFKFRRGRGREAQQDESAPIADHRSLTDEQRARIWVLRECGYSLRQIAEQCSCSASGVAYVLAGDPARLRTLQAVLADQRAARLQQIEDRSLSTLLRLSAAADQILLDRDGSPREVEDRHQAFLRLGAGWARLLASTGRDAGRQADRIGSVMGGSVPDGPGAIRIGSTPDDLIAAAIESGDLDALSDLPTLRARAERMIDDRRASDARDSTA